MLTYVDVYYSQRCFFGKFCTKKNSICQLEECVEMAGAKLTNAKKWTSNYRSWSKMNGTKKWTLTLLILKDYINMIKSQLKEND